MHRPLFVKETYIFLCAAAVVIYFFSKVLSDLPFIPFIGAIFVLTILYRIDYRLRSITIEGGHIIFWDRSFFLRKKIRHDILISRVRRMADEYVSGAVGYDNSTDSDYYLIFTMRDESSFRIRTNHYDKYLVENLVINLAKRYPDLEIDLQNATKYGLNIKRIQENISGVNS